MISLIYRSLFILGLLSFSLQCLTLVAFKGVREGLNMPFTKEVTSRDTIEPTGIAFTRDGRIVLRIDGDKNEKFRCYQTVAKPLESNGDNTQGAVRQTAVESVCAAESEKLEFNPVNEAEKYLLLLPGTKKAVRLNSLRHQEVDPGFWIMETDLSRIMPDPIQAGVSRDCPALHRFCNFTLYLTDKTGLREMFYAEEFYLHRIRPEDMPADLPHDASQEVVEDAPVYPGGYIFTYQHDRLFSYRNPGMPGIPFLILTQGSGKTEYPGTSLACATMAGTGFWAALLPVALAADILLSPIELVVVLYILFFKTISFS